MSYGAQIKLGIARQTAAGSGSAVTAPGSFHHIPCLSVDLGLEKDEVISGNLTGRFEQGAVYDGVNRIAGTIEFEPTPKALGAILRATCAAEATVTSGSLKTATFFPRTQDFSSLSIQDPFTIYEQWSDANSAESFFDCQFGQLEFTFAQGALLRARATVSGGSRVATGVGSLALTLDTSDLQLGMLWDATSISYGGAAAGMYSEVTVALNESIEPLYTLNGTLAPYKFTRTGFREVTVNGTLYFADRAVLNDFVAGTQKRLLIHAEARKAQVQSGYFASLTIDVPQMKISAFKPGVSGPGEVAVNFTARGVTDPNSGYAIKFVHVSTYAGPY